MKTSWLVGIVLTVHCVALGFILMMQGCGTTPKVAPGKAPEAGVVKPQWIEKAPVFPPPAPGASPSKGTSAKTTTYVVAKGDSLSHIAQKFKLSVAEIKALNAINDSNKLKVGQKLLIPAQGEAGLAPQVKKPAPPAVAKPKIETSALQGNEYVVKAGDSLALVAKAHGTTVEAIRQANNLKGDKIRAGQKLVMTPASAVRQESPGHPATPPHAPIEPAGAVSAPESTAAPQNSGVEQKTARPASAGMVRIHTVELGEDLDAVAMTWGVSVAEIKKLNGLTDDTIKPGQELKIPITE